MGSKSLAVESLELLGVQFIFFQAGCPCSHTSNSLSAWGIVVIVSLVTLYKGKPRIFIGVKGKSRERGWVLGEKAATPPHQLGLGVLWAPPAGFGVQPWPSKGFSLFWALKMTSPDTIMLLIVDYHAAIGGRHSYPLPLHTPLTLYYLLLVLVCRWFHWNTYFLQSVCTISQFVCGHYGRINNCWELTSTIVKYEIWNAWHARCSCRSSSSWCGTKQVVISKQ